jgi:hypothetical protein
MAIGDSASPAVQSYIAVGKETSYGTYASATTAIEALSCAFRTEVESAIAAFPSAYRKTSSCRALLKQRLIPSNVRYSCLWH